MIIFGLRRVFGGLGFVSPSSVGDPALVGVPSVRVPTPVLPDVARRIGRLIASLYPVVLGAAAVGLTVSVVVARWPSPEVARPGVNQQTVDRLVAEQTQLSAQVAALQTAADLNQQRLLRSQATVASLGPILDEQRAMAGTLALRGNGLDLVLDDSAIPKLLPSDDPDNYIVHEYQLRDIVNVLWGAGASGVSINGERVVNSTSVYCVGSTILINDARTAPPYRIVAIGDATRLQAALSDGNNLRDLKARVDIYGLVLKVGQADTYTLPAFNKPIAMEHTSIVAARVP